MADAYYSFLDKPCEYTESCLGAKLMRIATITKRQEALLAELESKSSTIPAGSVVLKEGEPADELIILKSGWVSSGKLSEDGTNSISMIHHPGDIVGFENIAFARVKNTCIAESDLVACRIPVHQIRHVFERSPRLSALLTSMGAIETAIISDRLLISRRNDSELRIGLFVLQIINRLRLMNDNIYDQFHCPLKQQQIGDATGLTSVHVSRTLARLEKRGLISRHKQFIRLLDEEALCEMIGFRNRYSDLDLTWLPEE